MASTLNDRFELIEPLPVAPGDIARAAYKARETLTSATPEDVSAARIVVLRLLPSTALSPSFTQASELAASLKSHPNILAHYGLTEIPPKAEIEPGLYAVSEYARGLTLRERIRRVAPFSLAVSLDIALAVTRALVYAHERGVAHGNLRPEHVLLTPEGQVRVGDFAITRATREGAGDLASAYSEDTRAVGLLLYEMLTGVAPDQMGIAGELSAREINPAIPPAIDSIARKATSLDTGRRYRSAAALLEDLQTAREDLRQGKPLTWSTLATPKGAGANRAITQPPGSLTQAADQILAEGGGNKDRTQPPAPKRDLENDYQDSPAGGSSVLSRLVMPVLLILVAVVIAATGYLFWQLAVVPNDVVVPNLIGQQLSDAQQHAANEHLNVVKAGDDYSDTWPTGTIYQMSPAPGRTIKSGKEISVYVSDGPRLTDVPDLTQVPLDKAKQMLTDAGLPLGTIAYDYSDILDKGSVISQDPATGSKISHETPINIMVSKGPPPPATPTDVSGSATIDGEIDLSWSDVPDATTYNVYRDGKRIATGLPQAAYSDMGLGSAETHAYTVTAVNANGESQQSQSISATTAPAQPPDVDTAPPATIPPPTPAPDETGNGTLRQRDFHILFRVPRNGEGRHNVQIEAQDATGTNIFYDQDHDPGDTIDENVTAFGNKVIFRIFIDGKLVKQEVK